MPLTPEQTCLNCGAKEPCHLDKAETSGDPENWPGSPCTFDPTPRQLWERLLSAQALIETCEVALKVIEWADEDYWCPYCSTNIVERRYSPGCLIEIALAAIEAHKKEIQI